MIDLEPKDPQGDYLTALLYLNKEEEMKALRSLTWSIEKIINHSKEGYYINDLDGQILDFSRVFILRAELYENYNDNELMCEDYNLALKYVENEDFKKEILKLIDENCN